jgi:hypothetical protein
LKGCRTAVWAEGKGLAVREGWGFGLLGGVRAGVGGLQGPRAVRPDSCLGCGRGVGGARGLTKQSKQSRAAGRRLSQGGREEPLTDSEARTDGKAHRDAQQSAAKHEG